MTNPFHKHQEEFRKLIKDYGVTYLALFGSRARGDHSADSDYDFLIDFDEDSYPGLSFFNIEQKLEDMLGKKVDVVTKNGISKYIKKYVKPDLKILYQKS